MQSIYNIFYYKKFNNIDKNKIKYKLTNFGVGPNSIGGVKTNTGPFYYIIQKTHYFFLNHKEIYGESAEKCLVLCLWQCSKDVVRSKILIYLEPLCDIEIKLCSYSYTSTK